jgi:hypothetical protein
LTIVTSFRPVATVSTVETGIHTHRDTTVCPRPKSSDNCLAVLIAMSHGSGHVALWAARLRAAGVPETLVESWHALRKAVASHQVLLREEGIGVEVNERDRVRVNARRVGLEAPAFADELDFFMAPRNGGRAPPSPGTRTPSQEPSGVASKQ